MNDDSGLHQLNDYIAFLYREADVLDRETGDTKDDLIRAGRQSAFLDAAKQLTRIAYLIGNDLTALRELATWAKEKGQ